MDTKRLGRFGSSTNNFDSHSTSFGRYEDPGLKPSLLDWDKSLFLRRESSLERVLAHARKTAEKSQRFINRINSKKRSSIDRAKSIPENATIRKEYIKCGKTPCYNGKHGPYYYAYWKDPETKRLKKKYIGQYLQPPSEEKKQDTDEI
jgi:hypothetical protein